MKNKFEFLAGLVLGTLLGGFLFAFYFDQPQLPKIEKKSPQTVSVTVPPAQQVPPAQPEEPKAPEKKPPKERKPQPPSPVSPGSTFTFLNEGPIHFSISSYQNDEKRTFIDLRNTSSDVLENVRLIFNTKESMVEIEKYQDIPGGVSGAPGKTELNIGFLGPNSSRSFFVKGPPMDEINTVLRYNDTAALLKQKDR